MKKMTFQLSIERCGGFGQVALRRMDIPDGEIKYQDHLLGNGKSSSWLEFSLHG